MQEKNTLLTTTSEEMVSVSKKRNQQIEMVLDQLKLETATGLGVTLGADQTSRNNGAVGGNMVKALIHMAQAQLAESNKLH